MRRWPRRCARRNCPTSSGRRWRAVGGPLAWKCCRRRRGRRAGIRIRGTPMREKVLAVAAVLLCATGAFASARITFARVLPPTYDLAPAERLAFIYAIGDSEHISDFVMDFVDAADRAGAYRIENAVENNHHLLGDETALRLLRREHPADASLGVTAFTCHSTDRSAEGSERDSTGDRVRRVH